jgi:hypothetical protein
VAGCKLALGTDSGAVIDLYDEAGAVADQGRRLAQGVAVLDAEPDRPMVVGGTCIPPWASMSSRPWTQAVDKLAVPAEVPLVRLLRPSGQLSWAELHDQGLAAA